MKKFTTLAAVTMLLVASATSHAQYIRNVGNGTGNRVNIQAPSYGQPSPTMIRDVGNGRFNRVNITSGQQGFQPQPGFRIREAAPGRMVMEPGFQTPQPTSGRTLIQNVGNGQYNHVNIGLPTYGGQSGQGEVRWTTEMPHRQKQGWEPIGYAPGTGHCGTQMPVGFQPRQPRRSGPTLNLTVISNVGNGTGNTVNIGR